MNDEPLVSILLLSMNHESFIERCIKSLKHQNYRNIEIIYLDNASSDNTLDVAKKALEQSYIPYQIFSNTESKGISKNLNLLYQHCSGEYVLPLSTDDWLTPDSIEEKINYFQHHPEFGMVYSSCYVFYSANQQTEISPKKHKFKEGWVLDDLLKEYFISTTGYVIKRTTIESVGVFDENSPLEDWDMCIRIAEKFPIGRLNKELAYYGIKNGLNITGNYIYMLDGYDYIAKKYAHYEEIAETKKLIALEKTYHYATHEPSFKTLFFILKNYRLNLFYFKQTGKTVLGMLQKALQPGTTTV
jgi:glycosyltransferase involved in cell wall biosynthesis